MFGHEFPPGRRLKGVFGCHSVKRVIFLVDPKSTPTEDDEEIQPTCISNASPGNIEYSNPVDEPAASISRAWNSATLAYGPRPTAGITDSRSGRTAEDESFSQSGSTEP